MNNGENRDQNEEMNETVQENKKKKRKKLLLILIPFIICLIAILVTVWALWFRETPTVLAPDYAPQDIEKHAETLGDDSDEKLEQPEGGGAVSLTYSTDVTVNLAEKNATLMFANPSKSNQEMLVQLVIRDTVIIQSGRLLPGNRVTTLDLLSGAEKQLTAGGYDGKLVIYYYQPDTGEKSVLNTEIPVTVTVK